MLSETATSALFIWVTLLTCVFPLVFGQDEASRYDILKGSDGQTSCDLRDAIFASCGSQSSPSTATPTPTLCTCNGVFFNIWSACSYSSGNNTLPIYSAWLATCTNASIDLGESSADMESGSYPSWAHLPIPGNASFDMQKAVVLAASVNKRWSPLQMVLPVVSAAVAVVLTAIFMKLYRRKQSIDWKDGLRHLVHRTHRIESKAQQPPQWVIEPESERIAPEPLNSQGPEDQYELIRPPSPVETVPGHPSHYSNSSGGGTMTLGTRFSEEQVNPFRPDARAVPLAPPMAPVRTVSDPHSGLSSSTPQNKWSLSRSSRIHIPNPFRRRPIQVIAKAPYKGWGIDQSTESSSSKRSTFATTGEGDPRTAVSSVDHMAEPMERSDTDYIDGSQDEHTNLITDDERRSSVLFSTEELTPGTRSGHSSSVNSHINVVSPSNSTSSPTSARTSRGTRGSFPRSPIPTSSSIPIPPLPDRPAPAPPLLPQRVPPRARENIPRPQQNYFLQERSMSPIQEDLSDVNLDIRQMAPLGGIEPSQSSQPSRQLPVSSGSGGSERRPLPSLTSVPGLVPPGRQSPQQQQASQPSSFSAQTHGSASGNSSMQQTHFRSSSADQPRPLPPTGGLPVDRQEFTRTSGHQRSGSNNSVSSGHAPSYNQFDDLLQPPPHRRGLSFDDSDSFYWTSEPANSPGRSSTPNSMRDPSAFFPGPVKGAGYGGFH